MRKDSMETKVVLCTKPVPCLPLQAEGRNMTNDEFLSTEFYPFYSGSHSFFTDESDQLRLSLKHVLPFFFV